MAMLLLSLIGINGMNCNELVFDCNLIAIYSALMKLQSPPEIDVKSLVAHHAKHPSTFNMADYSCPPSSGVSPKFTRVPQEGGWCRVGVGMLRDSAFFLNKTFKMNINKVSWLLGFLVSSFLVSWCLGFKVSKFQSVKVSRT